MVGVQPMSFDQQKSNRKRCQWPADLGSRLSALFEPQDTRLHVSSLTREEPKMWETDNACVGMEFESLPKKRVTGGERNCARWSTMTLKKKSGVMLPSRDAPGSWAEGRLNWGINFYLETQGMKSIAQAIDWQSLTDTDGRGASSSYKGFHTRIISLSCNLPELSTPRLPMPGDNGIKVPSMRHIRQQWVMRHPLSSSRKPPLLASLIKISLSPRPQHQPQQWHPN